MAGKLSMQVAYSQGAHLDCDELARFAVDTNPGDGEGGRRLKRYWSHGEGAAKIRWGTDGAFARCVRLLRKYFPKNPEGLCANLEKQATGFWPADDAVPS
jgi:hypothetical protein